MSEIEITAADKDLRSAIWRKLAVALSEPYPFNTADHVDREVEALVAAHRIAARNAALEEAAKVALHASDVFLLRQSTDPDNVAFHIATAIRNLATNQHHKEG